MRVAIVGAGLAGLTLASRLNQAGIDVEVFEKSRGLGGRLAAKRLDWGHINLGAQYVTARDPRFIEQLRHWQQQGVAEHWAFEPYLWKDGLLKVSPDKTQRFVGVPNMNKIAHDLAENLVIHRRIRITSMSSANNKHTLRDEYGERFVDFNFIVLSCPAEQTRELLLASDKVLAKSSLLEAIPERVHAPCWAAALATTGKISGSIQGIFGDDIVSWVSRLSHLPQCRKCDGYDDLWMLHFSSSWSEAHDINNSVTQDRVAEQGFDWLAKVLGSNAQSAFKLINYYCHYWRYARVDDACIKQTTPPGVMIDRTNRLAVIGDWCQGGRVEGAYLSALELADQLL